jgi:hypothetical protein
MAYSEKLKSQKYFIDLVNGIVDWQVRLKRFAA